MTFTTVLDVVIGLALVYLATSLLVTTVNEMISQALNMRAKQLVADLGTLINDPGLVTKISTNPALARFFPAANPTAAKPSSYVDPKLLAQQLIGAVQTASAVPATLASIITDLQTAAPSSDVAKQLLALAKSTDTTIEKLVHSTSAWIDESLTMLGEVYKKKVQLISLGIGFAAAAAFNIDSLSIVSRLWHDEEMRAAVAAYATDFVDKVRAEDLESCLSSAPAPDKANTCEVVGSLAKSLKKDNGKGTPISDLPIGYPPKPVWPTEDRFLQVLFSMPGWVLTALAATLGAPFWFDLLNRIVNLRGMRKPEEK